MTMLQRKKYIWMFLTLCVLYVSKGMYGIYESKIEKWRQQAEAAFEEVLLQEAQKWDTIAIHSYMDAGMDEKQKRKKRYTYLIPFDSLDVNALNKKWRELLYGTDVPTQTSIRILSTNTHETLESGLDYQPSSRDSLFSFYIGARREVELTGFISYRWWDVLDGRWPILIIMLVVGLGVSMLAGFLTLQFCVYWKNRRTVSKLGKNSNVAVDGNGHVTFYQLEKDVSFDTNQRIIRRKEEVEKLTPQQTILLEAFLKAEQYKLTQREIDALLWPDGSGTAERLYTAICRLRKSLEKMSSYKIDCQIDIYQLKKVDLTKNVH